MAKGECNCGAVSFEINTELRDVYVCHCSICRKATASGGIAVVVVNNNDFKWLKGQEQVKTWQKPGQDWETSFCINCGSALPGKNDDDRMYVPAGLISEGGEQMQVAHHIWVDSKAHWEVIADNGIQHPKGFGSC